MDPDLKRALLKWIAARRRRLLRKRGKILRRLRRLNSPSSPEPADGLPNGLATESSHSPSDPLAPGKRTATELSVLVRSSEYGELEITDELVLASDEDEDEEGTTNQLHPPRTTGTWAGCLLDVMRIALAEDPSKWQTGIRVTEMIRLLELHHPDKLRKTGDKADRSVRATLSIYAKTQGIRKQLFRRVVDGHFLPHPHQQ